MMLSQTLRRLAIVSTCLTLLPAQAKRAAPRPSTKPPVLPEVNISSYPWTPAPLQLAAQTDLVQTDVTVRDLHGNPVPGLQKSNFLLLEDGKPRPLSYFSVTTAHGANPGPAQPGTAAPAAASPSAPAAAPPRYIALYFDDIKSSPADLALARNAALRMLRAGLGPNDHICVFTASATQALDCAQDPVTLAHTVSRINPHPETGAPAHLCPYMSDYDAAQIALYNNTYIMNALVAEAKQCGLPPDSAQEFVEMSAQTVFDANRAASANILQGLQRASDYLARQLGQRVLLVASDGFLDDNLGAAVQTIIQNALRNDVVINALDSRGLFTNAPTQVTADSPQLIGPLNATTYQMEVADQFPDQADHEDPLLALAEGTGGYFFHNNNDLKLGFQQLASSPAIVYQLGFPLDVPHDGKYHTLKVALTPPAKYTTLQARPGYFAPLSGPTVAQFLVAMDNAMRSTDLQSAVPVTVSVTQRHLEADVLAHFNIAKLPFIQHLGRSDQKLFITAALFDSRGQLVQGKRGEFDMWLLPPTRRRFDAEGLQTRIVLVTELPGPYRLRVVVGETSDARLSAFTQNVQVH